MGKPQMLILGGGFGGMYATLQFEHMLARGGEQYRQPNPQVVTSRDILPRRHRIYRPRESASRPVAWARGTLPFVTLRSPVRGLGSITNFFNLPDLAAYAFTMKSRA
jgi:NADH dehydrogenase FAD-containing subunit